MLRKFSFKKSHDMTVENIIRIQEDLEQTRLSGHEVSFKDPAMSSEQFQATRRWYELLKRFYNGMPRKKNRRQFKFFDDTFTGKEASDYLLELFPQVVPNKSFDVANTEKFMQLLMRQNLVVDVRNATEKVFHPNACLYKFINDLVEKELEEKRPIRRASSLTNLKAIAKSESAVEEINKSVNKRIRKSTSVTNLVESIADLSIEMKSMDKSLTARSVKLDNLDPRAEYERMRVRSPQTAHPMDQYIEGGDYLLAWKHLLLKLVGLQSICEKLTVDVDGDYIKWNCTQIGSKGIVTCPNQNDDLSNDIKRYFQILHHWKREDESEMSPNRVFEHLYGKMCYISPIVPYQFSSKLAMLWKHFHRKANQDDDFETFFSKHDLSATTISSFGSPGMQYMDDSISGFPSRNRRNANNVSAIVDSKRNLYGALQVLLMSLKPDTRRKLNLVCRFMKRLQSNDELKLHESKTNLHYLVEKLGPCIIDFGVNLSLKDGLYVVLTLVESHTLLFSESPVLIHSARRYYTSRKKNGPAPQTAPFCQRIATADYELQKGNTDLELLKLLDNIIINENMSPSEKTKKLESFKRTYPHLYLKRFPNETISVKDGADRKKKKLERHPTPTGRLVQRIRSLTRRDSSKTRT